MTDASRTRSRRSGRTTQCAIPRFPHVRMAGSWDLARLPLIWFDAGETIRASKPNEEEAAHVTDRRARRERHSAAGSRPGIDHHPRSLYILFATEMWERFGFYTIAAVMTLYLQTAEGSAGPGTRRPGSGRTT